MRILIDECVPRRIKRYFRAYGTALTVVDAGFRGMANGQLLRRAAADFDVFITIDRHIESQQNLAAHDIAVVLLRVRSNDFADVEAVIPKLFDRWGEIAKRQLLVID